MAPFSRDYSSSQHITKSHILSIQRGAAWMLSKFTKAPKLHFVQCKRKQASFLHFVYGRVASAPGWAHHPQVNTSSHWYPGKYQCLRSSSGCLPRSLWSPAPGADGADSRRRPRSRQLKATQSQSQSFRFSLWKRSCQVILSHSCRHAASCVIQALLSPDQTCCRLYVLKL